VIDAKQARALALVAGTFTGILLMLWVLPLTPVGAWQRGLHWNYGSHTTYFAIPLIIMALARRKPAEYGLTLSNWRRELLAGGICFAVLVIAPLASEGLFGHVELKHRTIGFVCSTIVFQVIFSGFGEELLFRGFFQGELNRAFGRPFRWGTVRFGWGLILTAALFGFGHLLNPFNPFTGQFGLDITALFMTGVAGMVLGFVREMFGSIIAASLVHGGWDLVASLCPLGAAGNIAMGVGIFGVCWYLASVSSRPLSRDPENSGHKR